MSFFGWRIVAVSMLAQALGLGLVGMYAFVATPIVREFGASDAQIGMGMSILVLSMALSSPLLGPLLDRGWIRSTMLTGVLVMLGAAWWMARSDALWEVAVLFGLLSVGLAMYGHLPVTVLIVNWFEERRGTALALAAVGMSLSGFVVPPVSAWLVAAFGWRDAVALLATGAAVVVFPAIALLVVRRPEDVGQLPDGRPRAPELAPGLPPAGPAGGPPPGIGTRELIRDPNFWLLGFGVAFAMCVTSAGLFFVRHMEAVGITPGRASAIIAAMAVLSLAGKLVSGILVDRLDKRRVVLSVLLAYGAGWTLLATAGSFEAMLLACVPLAMGGGALLPLPAVLVGACFGRGLVGRVAGLHAPLGLPFLLSAAPLVGLARDWTGDYTAPFLGLAAALALSAAVLSFVRFPEQEPGAPAAASAVPREVIP